MSRSGYVTLPLRYAASLPHGGQCAVCGEQRYATRQAAERMIARKQLERKPGEKTEIRAYHDHGWWHVTSSPRQNRYTRGVTMHDPLTVAFDIIRPWPQRTSMRATSDDVRWRIRHHHEHWTAAPDSCGCPSPDHNPFPWWRPRSYSRFWRLAGRDYFWPAIVTIWHREPGGHDSLSVCSRRYQDKRGGWHYTKTWRWHVHHWKIQVAPLQHLRRSLLTRCEVCGGKSVKGHLVNVSHSWDRPKTPWWRGETGLSHMDCAGSGIAAKEA